MPNTTVWRTSSRFFWRKAWVMGLWPSINNTEGTGTDSVGDERDGIIGTFTKSGGMND